MIHFVYADIQFEINENSFCRYSDYSLHEGQNKEEQIYIIDEFDLKLQHPKETIADFIKFFKMKRIKYYAYQCFFDSIFIA